MTETEKARGQRIAYTMQSPGWPDLVRLLNELVQESVTQVNSFQGWDRDQKCDLMARQQACSGMRDEFFRRLNNFLLAASLPSENNTPQASTLADELRERALNETRIPGTYERSV